MSIFKIGVQDMQVGKVTAAVVVAASFFFLASVSWLASMQQGFTLDSLRATFGIPSVATANTTLISVVSNSSNLVLISLFEAPNSFLRKTSQSEAEILNIFQALQTAAIPDSQTVIVAPLNKAWAENGSLFDLFLESIREGDGTGSFMNHLIIFALDQGAYDRCVHLHKHCIPLRTEGVDFSEAKNFMTQDYLKMTKRKILFLGVILQLGFDFLFSVSMVKLTRPLLRWQLKQDVDIVWFRPPLQHVSDLADMNMACDVFNGNSADIENALNTGLFHARSNVRTKKLLKFWLEQMDIYPGLHDQDVFHAIKHSPEFQSMGVNIRFVPTEYFSGFCQLSNNMETVCTVHANCCLGIPGKIGGLKAAVEDWKLFKSMTPQESRERGVRFNIGCFERN